MHVSASSQRKAAPLLLGIVAGLAATSLPIVHAASAVPSLSLTTISSGMTIGGVVTLAAKASGPGLVGVTFEVSGQSVAPEITAGPCTTSWDTTRSADGSYTVTAVGRDSTGNTVVSAPALVTVQNAMADISSVTASNITSSTATISWITSLTADSQVEYGPSASYGLVSPLDTALVTAHTRVLGGLSPSTTYHYRVRSTNWRGTLSVSGDYTFMTTAGTSSGTTSPTTSEPAPAPSEPVPVTSEPTPVTSEPAPVTSEPAPAPTEPAPAPSEPARSEPTTTQEQTAVLSVSGDSSANWDAFRLSATVRKEAQAVTGAAVTFAVKTPHGAKPVTLTAVTNATGVAVVNYTLPKRPQHGTYEVAITAKRDALTGTGSTSFSIR